jgi:UDP-glucose 4-epimerase
LKVLVTGGGGFIGRNLVAQYAGRHDIAGRYDIAAPSRAELNLLDADAVREYLARHRFDAVIHAATERSNRGMSARPDLLDRNCRMFFNLARNRQSFGRMLFLSSGAVYGRAQWQPRMAEEYFDAHIPTDDYGFSKYVCAKAIDAMDHVYELRLFGVFGPHEDWRIRFLSNACARAVWDLPVVIRQNVRFDYLDAEDLGWILESFLRGTPRFRAYNVATGRVFDLRTLAELVVQASGKPLEIVVRNPGMGTEYSADNSRLLAELPDFHFREMKGSIARLYQWYEARREKIDPSALHHDA